MKPVNSLTAFVSTTEISVTTMQDWLCFVPNVPCPDSRLTDHVSIKIFLC
ncbi:rCG35000, isoform CRA_a, partial [Rattus norvegicus]